MGNRAARQRAGLEPYAVWVAVQTAVVAGNLSHCQAGL